MIVEALAALAIPTAAALGGRALATTAQQPPPPLLAGLVGALAPPLVVAWYQRPFPEQAAAWVVSLVGWGGLLLARDGAVLAAAMLAGGVWAALVALPTSGADGALQASSSPAMGPPPPKAAEEEGEHVRLELPCPSCGATVTFPVYHGMAQCRYCGSRHLVQREEAALLTVLPNSVTTEGEVIDAVVAHLRHQKYLELYQRRVQPLLPRVGVEPEGAPLTSSAPLDPVTLAAVNAAEKQVNRAADRWAAALRPQVKVLSWQPFLAPYWHRSGTLYQVAFGRAEDGSKRVDFAITHLEGAQRACSVPLPEMGKLSYLRSLRPLLGAPEASLSALPVEGGREELAQRLTSQEQRRASFPFRVIAVRGALVPQVEALVWRPWHLAQVSVRGRRHELLIDGAASRVAGQPPPALPSLSTPPTPTEREQIRLAPCRCPACGAELTFIPDAVAHLCGNCFRLLDASPPRLRPLRYLSELPCKGHGSLPFWRFTLALRTPEGHLIRDLDHLGDQLDGVLDQVGERPQGQSHLYVPAFRLRLSRGAVRFYRHLWPGLHNVPRTPRPHPFDPTASPEEVWPVTLPADEARIFGTMYLALSFTPRDLARAEARGMRTRFLEATLEGTPELTYMNVPVELLAPFRGLLRPSSAPAVTRLVGN